MIERKKWFFYLLMNILSLGLFTFYVGKKIKVYDKNKWYGKIYFWVLGFSCGIIPGLIMLVIFYSQIGSDVSQKLSVPYDNIYGYPYIWIICLIIPIVGWTMFFVLLIYTHFWYVIYIKRGMGEKI